MTTLVRAETLKVLTLRYWWALAIAPVVVAVLIAASTRTFVEVVADSADTTFDVDVVSTGVSLTAAMTQSRIFPTMVLQMCAIGEESGSIDHMLGKAADFYESEVDDMVAGLSSLMEPIIIVILGTIIGGIVVSMYLPIFKLGQVV